MKKYILILAIIYFGFACNQQEREKENFELHESGIITNSRLDTIIKYCSGLPSNSEVSIAIITNDSTYFYGIKKVNNRFLNINNRLSMFEIGSITKTFTGLILIDLVQEGIIDLNEPIQNSFTFDLKEAEKNDSVIKIINLANHNSGIPRETAYTWRKFEEKPYSAWSDFDTLKLKDYLKNEMQLSFTPGTKFEYSNVGYGVLGYIIERKTGSSYESLINEHILKRYQMKSTTSDINKCLTNLTPGLKSNGEIAPNWESGVNFAASSMLSNSVDLSNFAYSCLDGDSLFNLSCKYLFPATDEFSVSLGWAIADYEGGTHYIANGATGGYVSSFNLNLKKRNAVIVLSNVSCYNEKIGNIINLGNRLILSLE